MYCVTQGEVEIKNNVYNYLSKINNFTNYFHICLQYLIEYFEPSSGFSIICLEVQHQFVAFMNYRMSCSHVVIIS